MNTMDEWIASRPEPVRKLAAEFPPGARVGPDKLYVIGYTEDGMLIVSPYDPHEGYDRAVEARLYMCASHARES